MASDIGTTFLAALQAAVSVLLTIFYGVVAGQFSLVSSQGAKELSELCVKMLLPALLITSVGSELHLDTAWKYAPIFVWSIGHNALSIVLGMILTKLFRLPDWATPAIAFNNATSLPLLLVQALDTTGILDSILMGPDDTSSAVVKRAKAYFLVNAMVSDSLTFALGPRLLSGQSGDTPHHDGGGERHEDQENGLSQAPQAEHPRDSHGPDRQPDETTSLLPGPILRTEQSATKHLNAHANSLFTSLPHWAQATGAFLSPFLNAPVIGAAVAALIGLVPQLHRAFFAPTPSGGVFTAWLTNSIRDVGDLFAALQVIVVGVKLADALRRMKAGEDSGRVPWRSVAIIGAVRFVVWPAVAIGAVRALAGTLGAGGKRVLGDDPVLWFAMMLMPAGPPALKLTALAEVNGCEEGEKLGIAKFLTICYAVSPVVALAVVGSLRATESVR